MNSAKSEEKKEEEGKKDGKGSEKAQHGEEAKANEEKILIVKLQSDNEYTIGRSRKNRIRVKGDKKVSGVHAKISVERFLTDEGSSHGTLVNGEAVDPLSSMGVELASGDVVQVGTTKLRILFDVGGGGSDADSKLEKKSQNQVASEDAIDKDDIREKEGTSGKEEKEQTQSRREPDDKDVAAEHISPEVEGQDGLVEDAEETEGKEEGKDEQVHEKSSVEEEQNAADETSATATTDKSEPSRDNDDKEEEGEGECKNEDDSSNKNNEEKEKSVQDNSKKTAVAPASVTPQSWADDEVPVKDPLDDEEAEPEMSKEERMRIFGPSERRRLDWQRAKVAPGLRAPDRDRKTMNRVLCHAMGVRRRVPKSNDTPVKDAWD